MLGKSDYGNAWEQTTLYNISVIIMQDLTGIGKRSRTNVRDSEETCNNAYFFSFGFFLRVYDISPIIQSRDGSFCRSSMNILFVKYYIYIFLYYNKSSVWLIALNPSTVVSKTRFFRDPVARIFRGSEDEFCNFFTRFFFCSRWYLHCWDMIYARLFRTFFI